MEVCHFLSDSNMKIAKCRVKFHFLIIYVLGSRSIFEKRCYFLLFRRFQHKLMAAVIAKLMELYFAFFGEKKMVIKNISI